MAKAKVVQVDDDSDFEYLTSLADNEYSSIVEDGIAGGDVTSFIDTGSYTFNALLSGSIYGGIAGNKITALAGEPSTGKTFFAVNVVKSFLEQHPTGFCWYFESENATSRSLFVDRHVKGKRVRNMPIATIQEFRTQAVKILDGYIEKKMTTPMLMVLDSLGACSTDKEMEDMASGKESRDMTKAQLIKAAFRVITMKLGRANIPLLLTNHVYDVIGSYVPVKKMAGGSGLEYAASQIVFLSKKKEMDSDKKNVIGANITAVLKKSRLSVENKKVETLLDYQKGLDRYYGLTDLALKFGILKKVGNKIEFPNGETAFEKHINEDPEKFFTKDILDSIDAVCKDEFLYGKSNVSNNDETG